MPTSALAVNPLGKRPLADENALSALSPGSAQPKSAKRAKLPQTRYAHFRQLVAKACPQLTKSQELTQHIQVAMAWIKQPRSPAVEASEEQRGWEGMWAAAAVRADEDGERKKRMMAEAEMMAATLRERLAALRAARAESASILFSHDALASAIDGCDHALEAPVDRSGIDLHAPCLTLLPAAKSLAAEFAAELSSARAELVELKRSHEPAKGWGWNILASAEDRTLLLDLAFSAIDDWTLPRADDHLLLTSGCDADELASACDTDELMDGLDQRKLERSEDPEHADTYFAAWP